MSNLNRRVRAVARYGSVYRRRHLAVHISKRQVYQQCSLEALRFFLAYGFPRGRRDELSAMFRDRTFRALDRIQAENPALVAQWDGQLRQRMRQALIQEGVRHHGDREMVLGALDVVGRLRSFRHNIVRYAVEQLKRHRLHEVYGHLDSIPWIGDKLASFFLRDLVDIYSLEASVHGELDWMLLQPVDTWVRQVAAAIGISCRAADLRQAIVQSCMSARVSPIRFNQGAWYIGAHSLEIALGQLARG